MRLKSVLSMSIVLVACLVCGGTKAIVKEARYPVGVNIGRNEDILKSVSDLNDLPEYSTGIYDSLINSSSPLTLGDMVDNHMKDWKLIPPDKSI